MLVDAQGRQIEARIRSVSDGEVTIKRGDGRTFTLGVDKFDLRTQHMLRNWNERDVLARTLGATLKAVEIRSTVHGANNLTALYFRNSAGKALIDNNRISESIKYLLETTDLWAKTRSSDWGAHQAAHLLGFAMLLKQADEDGEKLLVEGLEGMLQTQKKLKNPKGGTLMMSESAERVFRYFEAKSAEESKRWKQVNESFQAQVAAKEKMPMDLGRLKKRTTAHFILASPYSSIGDYTRTAEKTWEELAKVIPSLVSDFEKGYFRTPNGQKGSLDQYNEDGQFKFLLVLADKKTLDPITGSYLETLTDARERKAATDLAAYNGFVEDVKNRFLVAKVSDPKSYTDPNDNFTFNRLIHNVPSALLKLTLRTKNEPHWLSSGIGYHFEHQLTGVASVHYSNMNFNQAGLRRYTDWHDAVRNLVRGGSKPNIKRMIWGGDRQAEDYGFLWALAELLLSTPEKQAQLGDFILQQRQNRVYMNEKEVALWFGYEDPEAMGRALSFFILSKAFD